MKYPDDFKSAIYYQRCSDETVHDVLNQLVDCFEKRVFCSSTRTGDTLVQNCGSRLVVYRAEEEFQFPPDLAERMCQLQMKGEGNTEEEKQA